MIYRIEKWVKEKLFGCQTCGQCILSNTKLICPMNCPKGLRNGPCGGTLGGKCEVIPEIDCVWTRIENKKEGDSQGVQLPTDPALLNTASYVNLLTGRDRETRIPKPYLDTTHIRASSDLATKMHDKEFVVTLEIASPRTPRGLKRVERIMERVASHVDAVNTTTNAAGKPSLHSTETGQIVKAYGVESVIQFCGRDHEAGDFLNQLRQAMQMGFKNFLLLTGDWLPDVDRPVDQQSWFPMDSSQMIHLANKRLEQFRDELGIVPYLGVAANPFSTPMPISVDRLAVKRHAGARFCQTQAITDVSTFRQWYRLVRQGREDAPKLTIPSIPLVGTRKCFDILCNLPGVYVDPELHRVVEADDFPASALRWAFKIAEGVSEVGAAGVHAMNFAMPPELIDEFLVEVRNKANKVRERFSIEASSGE